MENFIFCAVANGLSNQKQLKNSASVIMNVLVTLIFSTPTPNMIKKDDDDDDDYKKFLLFYGFDAGVLALSQRGSLLEFLTTLNPEKPWTELEWQSKN